MSSTTANIEIKVSNARIISADVYVLEDGSCKLTIETEVKSTTSKEVSEAEIEVLGSSCQITDEEDIFELVEASSLSIQDSFMNHVPQTEQEKELMELLTDAIKTGLTDFYRPRIDPSFDENGEICYKPGEKPAVDMSYNYWQKAAKEFCPERCSRLGTRTEYVAFLGVLIKRLTKCGWHVIDAWRAVCDDSMELGHYWNSKNTKHKFELTGNRGICKFFDLANTYKILAEDEKDDGFWIAGSDYHDYSYNYPIADLEYFDSQNIDIHFSVGWIVLLK